MNTTTTIFPVYVRDFVHGEITGDWRLIGKVIEYGKNAFTRMMADGSGYTITCPDLKRQYFVKFK